MKNEKCSNVEYFSFYFAILNYEKSLKYFSSDADLIHNLNIAQQRIKKPIYAPAISIKSLYYIVDLSTWATLCICSFFLACIFFIIFYLSSHRKWLLYLCFISLIIFIASITLGYLQRNDKHKNQYAIIVKEKVAFKSKSEKSAPTILQLSEGVKIQILQSDNDWAFIELPNHKKGWILRKNLLPI